MRKCWKMLCEMARLMIGVPDYDRYVAHMKAHHPEKPVMSYADFFAERQSARFGGKGDIRRCC
jgi:uncharacterized short protein YbdD (DUF466 family)